eukprot:CAMPEP_0117654208 /NCGR_PEP_ID=MMETSP0804-20121206/3621_1 /TAXON_ID=1074897 /ORGANISM="Tetraselmis astigmatica, Strain CCMP880" /LENGTH=440 /DNA_ID=CAMNT_0005460473 /DNA_START=236 /DNA_END=1558 /DNA_ORIENTATION=-
MGAEGSQGNEGGGYPYTDDAPEPVPEQLPPFFWVVLRGAEAIVPPTYTLLNPSKIVLLHGWLQDHTCWLKTAMKLRDTYGHDVLMLDFYGHGRSPYLPNFHHMNIYTCVRQLRELLVHVGWLQHKVVLAGISYGGGVAQHYALKYPDHVDRMVLLASVGQSEPKWRMVPLAVRALGAITSQLLFSKTERDASSHAPPSERASFLTRLQGKLWIARKYPQHDLPDNIHVLLRRFPLTLVWGRYDTLHSPNLRKWLCKDADGSVVSNISSSSVGKASTVSGQALLRLVDPVGQDLIDERPRATDNAEDREMSTTDSGSTPQPSVKRNPTKPGPRNDVNILLVPMEHTLFCLSIDSLKLHRYAHFWHGGAHASPTLATPRQCPAVPSGGGNTAMDSSRTTAAGAVPNNSEGGCSEASEQCDSTLRTAVSMYTTDASTPVRSRL